MIFLPFEARWFAETNEALIMLLFITVACVVPEACHAVPTVLLQLVTRNTSEV